jgi:hypothetical protein
MFAKICLADRKPGAQDRWMDPFARHKLRVDTALLEFERHSVKILISSDNGHTLIQRSGESIADVKAVMAESASLIEAARRVLLESR